MRKVLVSLIVLSLLPALAGAGASNPEGFEGYALTTAWDPTVIGEGWIRLGEMADGDPTPVGSNTVEIKAGSFGNTTQVLEIDSTGNGENLSALWYQSVADADAGPVTTTSFQLMPVIGYGNTEYRMWVARSTGYPGAYSWSVLLSRSQSVPPWYPDEFKLQTFDYGADETNTWYSEPLPGGDTVVVPDGPGHPNDDTLTWLTLEVEEDNGAYDKAAWIADPVNNHGSSTRARLKIADGEWNDWTGWLLHEDEDYEYEEGYIGDLSYTKYTSSYSNGRVMAVSNGRTEFDNFSMVWGPGSTPEFLLGNANNDGVVSADDYSSVQLNFGGTGDPGLPGDANGDGVVSADDYGSVQLNFGATTGMSGAHVPEPATLGLLCIGGAAMLRRKKRR